MRRATGSLLLSLVVLLPLLCSTAGHAQGVRIDHLGTITGNTGIYMSLGHVWLEAVHPLLGTNYGPVIMTWRAVWDKDYPHVELQFENKYSVAVSLCLVLTIDADRAEPREAQRRLDFDLRPGEILNAQNRGDAYHGMGDLYEMSLNYGLYRYSDFLPGGTGSGSSGSGSSTTRSGSGGGSGAATNPGSTPNRQITLEQSLQAREAAFRAMSFRVTKVELENARITLPGAQLVGTTGQFPWVRLQDLPQPGATPQAQPVTGLSPFAAQWGGTWEGGLYWDQTADRLMDFRIKIAADGKVACHCRSDQGEGDYGGRMSPEGRLTLVWSDGRTYGEFSLRANGDTATGPGTGNYAQGGARLELRRTERLQAPAAAPRPAPAVAPAPAATAPPAGAPAATTTAQPAPPTAGPNAPVQFSFDYPFNPDPGRRTWSRPDATTFVERYPSGVETRFRILESTNIDGNAGTIVRRQPEGDAFDIFIPDRGSEDMSLRWRTGNAPTWQTFVTMTDIRWQSDAAPQMKAQSSDNQLRSRQADFRIASCLATDGAWLTGWLGPQDTVFHPMEVVDTRFMGSELCVAHRRGADLFEIMPLVGYNATSRTQMDWPAGQVAMHPGYKGERAVLRWVAPRSGEYAFNVTFSRTDPAATTDVSVIHEGRVLFTEQLGTGRESAQWTHKMDLPDRSVLDFVVGDGANHDFTSDTTGIRVTIASEP